VVLVDLKLDADHTAGSPLRGLELIRRVREASDAAIVVVSGVTALDTVKEAMRLGALDYVFKPITREHLLPAVQAALDRAHLRAEVKHLRTQIEAEHGLAALVGESPAIRRIREALPLVAQSSAPVLLGGPSGSGKDHVARIIHNLGERAHHPFVPLNCGAIPAGLLESELFGHERGAFTGAVAQKRGVFELANGGTLFLDEIGEMPVASQVRLLRVLEGAPFRRVGGDREIGVDVRLIAASNRDLRQRIASGEFREDLFFRLNVIALDCPPLAERPEDIPALVAHFLAALGRHHCTLTGPALDRLQVHDWRGNVRELKNALERAAIFAKSPELGPDDFQFLGPELPPGAGTGRSSIADSLARLGGVVTSALGDGVPVQGILEAAERAILAAALDATGRNKRRAAALIGLERKALERRARRHGLG
jgi:DNA-binding NtrC family response regulator